MNWFYSALPRLNFSKLKKQKQYSTFNVSILDSLTFKNGDYFEEAD